MAKNSVRIDLHIVGFDCPADEITTLTGIQPTKTWQKGDLITPKAGVRHKENGWQLSSGISRHEAFESHIAALLALIEPRMERFVEIGRNYYTEISCALYMDNGSDAKMPPFRLDKRAAAVFQQIGAEIDFDLYITSRDD